MKAEFGRILEEPKAVHNVAEKFSNIEDKVLECMNLYYKFIIVLPRNLWQ